MNTLWKSFAITGSVIAAAVTFAAPSAAAPVYFCNSGGINLVTQGCISGSSTGYPGGGDGVYSNAGGGDPESAVEAAIFGATGTAANISLYGKSDSNPGLFIFNGDDDPTNDLSGFWDVADNSILIKYITVKAANSYALYEFAGLGANSGSFTTAGLLTPNGRSQPTVSHISFWTVGGTTAVPEPSTWLMMLAGFGFMGAAIRRRKQALAFA